MSAGRGVPHIIVSCCSRSIARDPWANSGHRKTGDIWACPVCGSLWVHECDEAEGCGWRPHHGDKLP